MNPQVGHSIRVPLKSRSIHGIVWQIHNKKPDFRTLNFHELTYATPLLTQNQIELIKWMSQYYFCHLHKLLKLFIPKRILAGKPIKTRKTGASEQKISSTSKKLTKDQKSALDKIKTSKSNKFLIHGITGSGKTEIYCRLANNYIKKDKQVLILVPEISLTPQTIEYFEKSIGIRATVIHSKLSEGERYTSWMNIWKNQAKLIIGSRSAIFAPFQNLELIIIDEEHENSYKQDNAPRYHTHTVAEKMLELSPKTVLILGSATPNIETFEKHKNTTITLNERIGESELPEIEIVDLREEFHKQNFSIFSEKLQKEISQSLKNKQQIILFLNRRGSASSVTCRDCGYTCECTDCEMPQTYHAKTLGKPYLICHHCGKISLPPKFCPTCKGPNIKFLGIGTQRIEQELANEFPRARLLRADKDTTSNKNGFREIYEKFRNHKADILIGTQMIAKGLHLPKVNLVGVVLADIGLNIPDFQTSQRNFQLMTQVAGRAGRSNQPGKVIIQTYDPENPALKFAQTANYEEFYKHEITQRKLLSNPPFGKLAKILIEDVSLKNCKQKAEKLENLLWKIAREQKLTKDLEVNIYPAYLIRLRGKYRYIVLIKTGNESLPHLLLSKIPKKYIIDPKVKIDIDPGAVT